MTGRAAPDESPPPPEVNVLMASSGFLSWVVPSTSGSISVVVGAIVLGVVVVAAVVVGCSVGDGASVVVGDEGTARRVAVVVDVVGDWDEGGVV